LLVGFIFWIFLLDIKKSVYKKVFGYSHEHFNTILVDFGNPDLELFPF